MGFVVLCCSRSCVSGGPGVLSSAVLPRGCANCPHRATAQVQGAGGERSAVFGEAT